MTALSIGLELAKFSIKALAEFDWTKVLPAQFAQIVHALLGFLETALGFFEAKTAKNALPAHAFAS